MAMAPGAICPHCGFDLKVVGTVTRGRWQIDRTCVRFDGIEVRLTKQAILIMHALASVAPMIIEPGVLGERVSDGGDPVMAVRNALVRIKQATGPHFPIEGVKPNGYRWVH